MTLVLKRASGDRVRWRATVDFKKYDDTKGISFGYSSFIVDKSGSEIVDHDEDVIEPKDLEAASYKWVEEGRTIGEMHTKRGVGNLVEAAFLSPEKRQAMGGFDPSDKSVGMWIGARWTDPETRSKAQKGQLKQWSISGWAKRVPVGKGNVGRLTELELDEISAVDRGAGKGVDMALAKRRKEEASMFGKLVFKALAFIPKDADGRAELLKKLGGEDGLEERLEKMASMEDIKSKLTAEEWDLILANLVPSAVDDAEDPEAPPADPAAPPMPPKRKVKKTAKAKPADEPEGEDPMPTDIQKKLDEFEKKQAEFEKREKISKYRTEVITSSFLKFYPGKAEETAMALMRADDAGDKEGRKSIEKAARALKESALLKTHGTARDTDDPSNDEPGGEDAGAKIIKMVNDRLEKGDGKKSFTTTLEEIAKRHPDLYREYYEDRRRRGGATRA